MYQQTLSESAPCNKLVLLHKHQALSKQANNESTAYKTVEVNSADDKPVDHKNLPQHEMFEHIIKPSLKLAIFGGGIDAVPVAKIAADLSWQVLVAGPRTGYARQVQFPDAEQIIKAPLDDVTQHQCLANSDAIVIMTHNLNLDAQALVLAQSSSARYIGMLEPIHRTDRVLAQANLIFSKLPPETKLYAPNSVSKVWARA
ncbi:MAG: xanthine dehydrogenase accessory factor [Glaciecola sp.]|jgi:xanthine dehydrogenase accessory factor